MGSKHDFRMLRVGKAPLFFIVYPETDADHSRFHCGGGHDLGLGDHGKLEMLLLAKKIQRHSGEIEQLVSSPELRAIQASDFIHDELQARLQVMREFADQDLGCLEGAPLQRNESSGVLISAPLDGEEESEFIIRIRRGLVRIFEVQKSTLLVCHLRVANQVLAFLGIKTVKLRRGVLYSVVFLSDHPTPVFGEFS